MYCGNLECARKTFAEQVPELAALERLDDALACGTAGGATITARRGEPWIGVPKLEALPEPRNLVGGKLSTSLWQNALAAG